MTEEREKGAIKGKKRIDNTFYEGRERGKSAILIQAVGGEGICTSKWSSGGGSVVVVP
jgi:hypothetical protein